MLVFGPQTLAKNGYRFKKTKPGATGAFKNEYIFLTASCQMMLPHFVVLFRLVFVFGAQILAKNGYGFQKQSPGQ